MTKGISESELLSGLLDLLQYLENAGKIWKMRLNSGVAFIGGGEGKKKYAIRLAPVGTADVLVISREHGVVWFETKTVNGKQTPEQIAFQVKVEKQGCLYILVRDLQEVINIVEGW